MSALALSPLRRALPWLVALLSLTAAARAQDPLPPSTTVSGTLAETGAIARYTVAGTAGQVVAVRAAGPAGALTARVLSPTGQELRSATGTPSTPAVTAPLALPADGDYTVELRYAAPATGAYTVRLVPSLVQSLPNAAPWAEASGSISEAGQRAYYTFEATAGAVVSVDAAASGALAGRLVVRPLGGQVTAGTAVSDALYGSGDVELTASAPAAVTALLATAGTYVVEVNGGATSTGTFALRLSLVRPADALTVGTSPNADTGSLRAALRAVRPNGLVRVEAGVHEQARTVYLRTAGVRVEGAPGAVVRARGTISLLEGQGASLQLRGLTFDRTVPTIGTLVALREVHGGAVEGCRFEGPTGGLSVAFTNGVRIANNEFRLTTSWSALTVTSNAPNTGTVESNTFVGVGTGLTRAVVVGPGTRVVGNTFTGALSGFSIAASGGGVTVESNAVGAAAQPSEWGVSATGAGVTVVGNAVYARALGVHVESSTSATEPVTVARNEVRGGAGLSVRYARNALVEANLVEGTSGSTPGLELRDVGGRVVNNRVTTTDAHGVDVQMGQTYRAPTVVANNSVRVAGPGRYGVRFYSTLATHPVRFVNNVVAGPATGSGTRATLESDRPIAASDYNVLSGFSGPYSGVTAGAHDVVGDPLFADAALRLSDASPAVDRGTADGAPAVDFEGRPRPQGAAVDVGAHESVASGQTAQVTFAVSLVRARDAGLFAAPSRPFVHVADGAFPGRVALADGDGDGVWTATLAQAKSATVHYAFGVDLDGQATTTADALVELTGQTTARTLTLGASDTVLPTVDFDGQGGPAATGYAARVVRTFTAGWPLTVLFDEAGATTGLTLAVSAPDRPLVLAVRRLAGQPAGATPPGIATVSSQGYWGVDAVPAAAGYTATLSVSYAGLTGVTDPAALRFLHRSGPDAAWAVVPTTIDPTRRTLAAPDAPHGGEWAVGSTTANPLDARLPGHVHTPDPADGAVLALNTTQLRLSWRPATDAQAYDLSFWPVGQSEPAAPTYVGATGTERFVAVEGGRAYRWRVTAVNPHGQTAGPEWGFTVAQYPDLVVDAVTLPQSAASGQTVVARWTVRNAGTSGTTAPRWRDRLYFSADDVLDAGDLQIAILDNPAALAPGEGYTQEHAFAVPSAADGGYHAIVVTDAGQDQREADETRNTRAGAAMAVALTTPPDLRFVSVSAPDQAFSGAPVRIEWTARNAGATATATARWYDEVWLSEDREVGNGDVRLLAPEARENALAAGYTYSEGFTVTLPERISGKRYVLFTLDRRNGVYEHLGEGDNVHVDSVQVTLSPPADLVASALEAPAGITAGVPFTVRYHVENAGAAAAPRWRDRFFLSTDAEVGPDDVELAAAVRQFPTGASSGTFESSLVAPPDLQGAYHVLARIDGFDEVFEHTFEVNNWLATAAPVPVALGAPVDLQVRDVRIDAPAGATAGARRTVRYTVRNAGTGAAAAGWTDRVSLVPATGAPVALATVRHTAPLGGGGAVARVAEVDLPAGLATGTYTLHVAADVPTALNNGGPAWANVYEHEAEGNNVGQGAPFAVQAYPATDLAADAVTAPAEMAAGGRYDVSWTVRNGPAAATLARSWSDRVLLSADPTPSTDDVVLASAGHTGALAPSATYTAARSVTVPESLDGPFHVLVVADAESLVQDPARANNVAGRAVAVGRPASPNLVVEALTASPTGVAGQPVAVTFTVRNTGAGPTRADRWLDDVRIAPSADGAGAVHLGRALRATVVEPGGAYTATLSVNVPVWLATGTYYVLAAADGSTDVYEHGAETDNARATAISVTLPPPADLVVASVTAPETLRPGQTSRVVYEVRNAGTNRAQGQTTDAVYVSEDDVWDASDPLLTTLTRQIDLAPGALARVAIDVDAGRLAYADARGIALADTAARLAAGASPEEVATGTVLDGTTPGLPLGPHYVLVRADVRDNIREANDANNTTPTDDPVEVEVPLLTGGQPAEAFVMQGTEWYARFEAAGGESVELALTSDHEDRAPDGLLEVFVRHGGTPSRAAYDHVSPDPRSYNQRLVVPDARPGTYYVVVRGSAVFPAECPPIPVGGGGNPGPPPPAGCDPHAPSVDRMTNFSLTARTLDFAVERVEGDRIGDRGQATVEVFGAQFAPGATAVLRAPDGTERSAFVTNRQSSTHLVAAFQTDGLAHGAHAIVVRHPGGAEAALAGAVTVEAAQPMQMLTSVVGASAVRVGTTAAFNVVVENPGNVNVERALTFVTVKADVEVLSVERPAFDEAVRPWDARTDTWLDTLDTGEVVRRFALAFYNVGPGRTRSVQFVLRPIAAGRYSLATHAYVFTDAALRAALVEGAEEGLAGGWHTADEIGDGLDTDADGPDLGGYAAPDVAGVAPPPAALAFGNPCEDGSACGGDEGVCAAYGNRRNMGELFEAGGGLARSAADMLYGKGFKRPGASFKTIKKYGNFLLDLSDFQDEWTERMQDNPCSPDRPRRGTGRDGEFDAVASRDPNDLVGPAGYGDDRWVPATAALPYTVRFENTAAVATAPAQRVEITEALDPALDPVTFRLGDVGFAGITVDVPDGRAFYQARVDARDSLGVFVDVTAGVDVTTGRAFWTLAAVDPATGGTPTNPLVGLLPVNDAVGRGEGFVRYSVRPRAGVESGAVVGAQARIVFDAEAPIDTPPFTNRIDAGRPASHVLPLEPTSAAGEVRLAWTGTDAATGVGQYALYVSADGGPFGLHESGLADTTAVFAGEPGRAYGFYVLATDRAGNAEPGKTAAEATTIGADGVAVYPGDANADGRVTQADLLPVGVHFGRTGPARAIPGTEWEAHAASQWTPAAATHADTNGDGAVGQADLLPVGVHFGRDRSANRSVVATAADAPRLVIPPLAVGRTVTVTVRAGTEAVPADSLLGVAARLQVPTGVLAVRDVRVGAALAEGVEAGQILSVDERTDDGDVAVAFTRRGTAGGVRSAGAEVVVVTLEVVGEMTRSADVTLAEAEAVSASGRTFAAGTLALHSDDAVEAPVAFELGRNYPNPFHGATHVGLAVPERAPVTLEVFDVRGRLVMRVLDEQELDAGHHQLRIDASGLAAGLYVYRLRARGFAETRRMTVVR